MKEFTIRFWQPPDIPDLQKIFTAAHGDPPEIVEAFHRAFLTAPEVCLLAAVPEAGRPEGRPVAAGYSLPGPVLCFSGRQIASVYLYALGCLPEWRGRGIGMQLHTALSAETEKQAPVSCMIPAAESLLQAYNRISPLSALGQTRFAEMTGDEIRAAEALPAERLPWQEYARRREEWLRPYPHAAYPDPFYTLSAEYGNVFLSLPGALAAVIPLEDRCIVSELLCPGADPARALAGTAAACSAEKYEVRTPAFFPGPGKLRPFAYYHDAAGDMPAAEDFWYPFGLE